MKFFFPALETSAVVAAPSVAVIKRKSVNFPHLDEPVEYLLGSFFWVRFLKFRQEFRSEVSSKLYGEFPAFQFLGCILVSYLPSFFLVEDDRRNRTGQLRKPKDALTLRVARVAKQVFVYFPHGADGCVVVCPDACFKFNADSALKFTLEVMIIVFLP